MKRSIAVLSLFLASMTAAPTASAKPARVWNQPDYQAIRFCPRDFCLELIELAYDSPLPKRGTALLIPGFFQNGRVYDLMPEKGLSVARHLMKEKGLKIYLLHVRGIGNSDRTRHYSLDDVSSVDIPSAIEFVSQRENEKILVIGHSQGGITGKAALSGLTRCARGKNCFDAGEAAARQAHVRGMLSIAANATMSTRFHPDALPWVARLGEALHPLTGALLDYVPARKLLKPFSSHALLSELPFWDFLYSVRTMPRDASEALLRDTLDGSSFTLINQFADGVTHGGIRASSGEPYIEALRNVHVPVAEVAFGKDFFAPPLETYIDSYLRLENARFFSFEGQRHEDFMLDTGMQGEFDEAVEWLLGQ